MACHLANNSNASCIKFIGSETLMNSTNKEQHLFEIFNSCCKSESFCIILDSLEKIISYSRLGNLYDNKILQVIYTMLSKIMQPNKKGVIIITSSLVDLMEILQIDKMCSSSHELKDYYYPDSETLISTYFKLEL